MKPPVIAEQRVAVRRRLRDAARRRRVPPAPVTILDDEGPAEALGQLLREEPRLDVGAAAGRLPDDDAHGLGGVVVLRQRRGRQQRMLLPAAR